VKIETNVIGHEEIEEFGLEFWAVTFRKMQRIIHIDVTKLS
jgi:hypothetical protein